jgi:hypothetical protein
MDESYVHENHISGHTWNPTGADGKVMKELPGKKGKGRMMIMIGGLMREGTDPYNLAYGISLNLVYFYLNTFQFFNT